MIVAGDTIARPNSLMRRAGLLIAIVQIALGAATLLESGSRNANAHIESKGVELHYAHDEATCAACISQQLLTGAEPTQRVPILAVAKPHGDVGTLSARGVFSPRYLRNSRAPPHSAQNDS